MTAEPKLCQGGILADDMGLGKTITMLSLIALDTVAPAPVNDDMTTLVVVPLSVLDNWTGQIKEHVALDVLPYYVYHGVDRVKKLSFLQSHRVILTTYGTLSHEFQKTDSKRNGPLFKMKFRRIILDEGHLIKNPAAKQSQACFALKAQFRFVCTGTPITNELKVIYSLLKFLRVSPFDDKGNILFFQQFE